jgi:hypothetical protein
VFAVQFEWRRLIQLCVVMGGIAVAGDLLLPTHGFAGFITRAAAFAAIPAVLLATGFAHPQELSRLRSVRERVRGARAPMAAAGPVSGPDQAPTAPSAEQPTPAPPGGA